MATKENIIKAYKNAKENNEESVMEYLTNLFPEIDFKKCMVPVWERINNLEEAIEELGHNHPYVVAYNAFYRDVHACVGAEHLIDVDAYLALRIVVAAYNEGWEPKFTEGEWRYYPYYWLYTKEEWEELDESTRRERGVVFGGDADTGAGAGFASARSYYAPSGTGAYLGSRLCFYSAELARECAKRFPNLWYDYLIGIRVTLDTQPENPNDGNE